METAREKLGLHVQRGSLGLEHNEVFLQQAQSAWLGDWAVGRGSGYDTPRDGVRDVLCSQRSNVPAHSFPVRPVIRVVSPNIVAVFPPAFFESSAGQSRVKFHSTSVSSRDLGSIYHGLHRSIRVNSALAGDGTQGNWRFSDIFLSPILGPFFPASIPLHVKMLKSKKPSKDT